MKQSKYILVLLLALTLLAALAVFASAETLSGTCGDYIENLKWTLDTESGVLTISGHGSMSTAYNGKDFYETINGIRAPWAEYDQIITTVVIEEGVDSIGSYAFEYCSALEEVSLPNSLTKIGYSAFSHCSSLSSIVIPIGVTCIQDCAFAQTAVEQIVIPDGVTEISHGLFGGCESLNSVTIPNSVTKIEMDAFTGCVSLKDVTIPDGVTSIGGYAFNGCKSLKNVTIPDGVTSIGNYAFHKCDSLKTITFPATLQSVGDDSFSQCKSLTKAYFTDLGAMINSSALKEIMENSYYSDSKQKLYLNGELLTDVVIPDTVTIIPSYTFLGYHYLKSVVIGDNVTRLGEFVFEHCGSLNSVIIGNNIKSIPTGTFEYCDTLESIVIPEGVIAIGQWAFLGCTALKSVTIPSTVTVIYEMAFCGPSSLERVDISDLDAWCKIDFINSSNPLIWAHQLYCNGELVTHVTIPKDVRGVGNGAFSGCTSLKSVTIPSSLRYILENAFNNCSNLRDVYFDGDEAAWRQFDIHTGNEPLKSAAVHFTLSSGELLIINGSIAIRFAPEAFLSNISLDVEFLADEWYNAPFGKEASSYNISPVDQEGNKVQPNRPVQLRVSLPSFWMQKPLLITHTLDNGEVEKITDYEFEGEYYVTFWVSQFSRFEIKLDHIDENNDGYCDICNDRMSDEGLCAYCGLPHEGFAGAFIAFFHRIAYFFAHLFGKM